MIGRWLLLARGQVRVRVTGASLTRFLNVCARNELTLHRMKRTAWNEMYATMSLRDFRALRAYMGRTGCRVHIVRRQGAPFAAARLRPRYVLWGGALALLLMCWVLCTRIWSIEWHIDPALPQAELISQLDELGVHIGVRRRAVNVRQVRWRMMQKQPRLSFLALNVDGNRLIVEAQAGVLRPELLDGNAVVRVVAAREGVVESVRAAEGQPQVRQGDAVSVGDTLISGLVPPTAEQGAYHLAHARGEVRAYTSYQIGAARALTSAQKRYTDKVKRQFALAFGNKRLNLYLGSGISGGTCDKIVETKLLRLSDSVVFPVKIVVQTYTFYEPVPQTEAVETAQEDMLRRALDAIAAGMDGEILSHTESVTEQNGAAVLRLNAAALEQIGEEALDDSTIPEPEPPAQE